MNLIGILTEKPSAMRNFAKALGGQGGIYNGERYILVSARGHLYEYVNPEEMVSAELASKHKSWSLAHLPWNENDSNWKKRNKKDTETLLADLKKTLSECNEIVIATDIDPTGEGDMIAGDIITRLKLTGKKISRMRFLDESEKEITKAFKTRRHIPNIETHSEYIKAQYRAKFDFLTMQFTRIAKALGDGQSVLRQGRLKSVMVKITGDGLSAFNNYKKIPFYQNKFKDENGNIYTNADEQSFTNRADVPVLYCSSAVIKDRTERKKTPPKKLLDLAGLSAILSAKGIKAEDVLSVYQKMYEAQIVSYPRTEDKIISPEQFEELLPLCAQIAEVVGVNPELLTHKIPRSTHIKTGGAHGANRPGLKVPANLAELAQYGECATDIYTLLAKSYLAMLAPDYEYDAEYGYIADYPDFKATVSIPKVLGWKAVFVQDDDESDNEEEKETGKSIGTQAEPFIHEGFPPKPPHPSMKWLMKQLGKYDVGTGATRTSTYADVTSEKVKYPLLKENRGKLTLTEFGEKSYILLPRTKIGSIELTEEVQQDMRALAAGKVTAEDLLPKMQDYVRHDMKIMAMNGAKIEKKSPSKEIIGFCPRCKKGEVCETPRTFSCASQSCGFALWKSNKFFETAKKPFTKAIAAALLKHGKVEVKGLYSSKKDKTYDAIVCLDDGGKYVNFKLEFKK